MRAVAKDLLAMKVTAPATLTLIQCRAGNVTTANAWELGDAQGTVRKRSASSLEGTTKEP